MLITSAIISGLGLGSMYGLIALGFHVTYVVSNTVNFSQGSAMMLGAVLGYTFAVTLGWPVPLAVALSLTICALFGLVVERALVRPFAERGSNAWLMATVAGGIVLDNAVLFTFGKEPRSFPSVLAAKPVEIFGAGVYPLQLVIPVVGLGIALALHLVFHRTRLRQGPARGGAELRRRAADGHQRAFRHRGLVHDFDGAGRACGPADRAAVQRQFRHGHAVRDQGVRGGDPRRHHFGLGCDAGRTAYGLIESLVTAFFGSVYTQIVTFSVVILALAVMPNGFFGRAAVNKV